MRLVYGDLIVDTARLVITRAGVDVHVQPQVFDVLSHLLAHRDRVVTKEELLDEIWGDRFVSESALTSRIKSVRQLVGDDGIAQRAIKTVHGRGYRWIAPVEIEHGAAEPANDGVAEPSPRFGPLVIPPPRPLADLIGREREAEIIRTASPDHRLVTLIGPPGVGKSRLAVEIALATAERGDVEVAFVDLRPVTSGDDVLAAFRGSVHVADGASSTEPAGTRDRDLTVEALVDLLRRRRILLLIDNCEHLVDEVAALCRTLLRSGPDVAFLTTSRRRLGLEGEYVVPIEPMPLPTTDATTWEQFTTSDAGRLFIERSRAAGARWEESPEQVALAAELCHRLDGLPLALELAAARTRWMSLPDLMLQLTDETERGGPEPTDGPLQVALRSSRSRLSVDERHAFDALSVFAASFTIDAALSVIGTVCPHGDALAIFETLIDHSLVDVISGPRHRYRLLETVQRYAESCRLASDDPDLAVRAHFDHYLRFVEKRWPVGWISTSHPWSVLTAERTELHAAIRRAADDDPRAARRLIGSLGWYWWIDGDSRLWDELETVLDASTGDDPDRIAAPFAWTQAIARVLLGRDPVPFALDAVERARRAEQWSVAAWALAFSVAPDMMWIDLAPVSDRWAEIVELFRRNGDACGEAWAMVYVLGYAEVCAHRHDEAAATYEAAAALFERCGDRVGRSRALLEIVELNIWTGDDPARARAFYDTITGVDELPIESWMKLQWLGGLIAEAEGDPALAVQLHMRALEASERHIPAALLTNTYRCFAASSLRRAGRFDESAGVFLEVMSYVSRRTALPGWHRHAPWVLESIGGLLIEVGRQRAGIEIIGAALGLRDELDAPMPYWDERRLAPDLDAARAGLGEDALAAALTTGRDRDLDATFAAVTVELAAIRMSTPPR